MKKLLISLLLISIFTSDIYGETYIGDFDISLSYSKESNYKIKIPKIVDVSNNSVSFNYYVSGDIYADQILNVLFDDSLTLYNNSLTCTSYISQEKDSFSYQELSSLYKPYQATITHQELSSGKWYGELKLMISLTGGN